MRFGVAKTFFEETLINLQNTKFSLNIDESISNNHMHVLTILTSYFFSSINRIVIEHFVSLSVSTVTSERFYNKIKKFFDNNQNFLGKILCLF